jgi:exodeoxyribonuclease V beta subunit
VLEIAGQPVVPLQFWYLPGINEHGVTGPGSYRRQMSDATASQIVHWLELARQGQAGFRAERGLRCLQPRDIAILVRTGSEAAEVRQSLQHRGVNSVYLSDKDSVFETVEAHDLHRWLMAVAHPSDERLLKAALATASLRLPLDRLREWFEQEDQWEAVVERFRRYQRLWQTQGVLPMLRGLLWDFGTPERCLADPQGERSLTNLLHLSEWLQQTSGSVDGELALIRRLAQQMEHPTEEQILRLESDADLIKVVTIHKSKGLEYPLVLLPFICTFRDNARQAAVDFHRWCPEQRNYPLWTELAGQRKLAEEAYRQADEERLNEDLRLLYVALTRAQHGLWLGITPLGGTAQSRTHQLNRSAIGQLLFGSRPIEAAEVPRAIQSILQPCESLLLTDMPTIQRQRITPPQDTQLQPARTPARRQDPRWWIASYSALRTQQEAAPELPSDEQSVEEPWSSDLDSNRGATGSSALDLGQTLHAFPRGPQAGTFLHSILEWATERGFDRVAEDTPLRRNYLQRIAHSHGWSQWVEVLDVWLSRLLKTFISVGAGGRVTGFRLAEISAAQSCAELEFWFEVNRVTTDQLDRLVIPNTLQGRRRAALEYNQLNGLLKGFIDLIFEYDGRYYILDWKSNYLGPDTSAYDLESLREAIAEKRYDLQYVLYLLALHRHLSDRLPNYSYDAHVGGAAYVFLRGFEHPETCGVHFELPPANLIYELDELFVGAQQRELRV